jgi:hypothetical protein
MIPQEQITFGIACVGAVLGVINTWRTFDRDRIRLRVGPGNWLNEFGESGLMIEVTNLSYFPVTVAEAGFGMRRWKDGRFLLPVLQYSKGCEGLPHRMEPRTAMTILFRPGADNDSRFAGVHSAFVRTACGQIFRGSSPALRGHLKKLRRAV